MRDLGSLGCGVGSVLALALRLLCTRYTASATEHESSSALRMAVKSPRVAMMTMNFDLLQLAAHTLLAVQFARAVLDRKGEHVWHISLHLANTTWLRTR